MTADSTGAAAESSPLADDFCLYAIDRLEDSRQQIHRCLGLLSPEQVWHRPNEVSNAIGNLVIHLTGNVRQWIVSGLGGEPFDRDRPAEFAQRDILPSGQIQSEMDDVLSEAAAVIGSQTSDSLTRPVTIQGYQVTGLRAVFHVVEHFSLHTGQIVYATKLLTGRDLSLYDSQGRRLDGGTGTAP